MENLGVEMTVLTMEDRTILMKGMILRRLAAGCPLDREQLDVGIEQDFIEIQKRFSTFDFETYVGCDLDAFYNAMTSAMLIEQRDADGKTLYERGQLADEFVLSLSEDMDWMVDALPMSTRGLFDNLRQNPTREVVMDINDVLNGEDKRVVEDTRDKQQHNLKDHQLRG
jgi:hypothetical protein